MTPRSQSITEGLPASSSYLPEGVVRIAVGHDNRPDGVHTTVYGYGKGDQCWVLSHTVSPLTVVRPLPPGTAIHFRERFRKDRLSDMALRVVSEEGEGDETPLFAGAKIPLPAGYSFTADEIDGPSTRSIGTLICLHDDDLDEDPSDPDDIIEDVVTGKISVTSSGFGYITGVGYRTCQKMLRISGLKPQGGLYDLAAIEAWLRPLQTLTAALHRIPKQSFVGALEAIADYRKRLAYLGKGEKSGSRGSSPTGLVLGHVIPSAVVDAFMGQPPHPENLVLERFEIEEDPFGIGVEVTIFMRRQGDVDGRSTVLHKRRVGERQALKHENQSELAYIFAMDVNSARRQAASIGAAWKEAARLIGAEEVALLTGLDLPEEEQVPDAA